MMVKLPIITLAVYLYSCTSLPVEEAPLILRPAPKEILFRDEMPLVLKCDPVQEQPGVRYTWKKDGQDIQLSSNILAKDSTLTFLNPNQTDEGSYQCLAETTQGTASTRITNVRRTYIHRRAVSLVSHKPVIGQPFKLDCTIPEAYPVPQITWMYQFITDPSISHTVLDRRVTQSPDGTLWFSNITKEDANDDFKYVCLAKSPASDDGVVLAEHVIEDVLDGQADGELIPQYLSQDLTAKVGDVTMIYCIYGGTPLGHPDWFKDGTNVNNQPRDRVTRYNRSSGRRLLIRETWLKDQDVYTCTVENGIGKPQTHSMRLNIVSAPQFTANAPPTTLVQIGEDVTIPCHIAGVPNPKMTWTYNSKPLPTNDRIIVNNSIIKNNTISDLIIKKVAVKDLGYYGCRGVNQYGDEYAETLFHVVDLAMDEGGVESLKSTRMYEEKHNGSEMFNAHFFVFTPDVII